MPASVKSKPAAVPLPDAELVNPPCEVCGNHYAQAFTVVMDGVPHVFDSFECAIHQLAPVCAHCGCRILGHGLQSGSRFYCCSHCAREAGEEAEAGEMLSHQKPGQNSNSARRL
jgi:hypothetical protein